MPMRFFEREKEWKKKKSGAADRSSTWSVMNINQLNIDTNSSFISLYMGAISVRANE